VREALVTERERRRPGPRQKELFAPPPDPIVEQVRALDLDGITPRQALELLADWQAHVKARR
jgi:DNA mismatch repair protein MutS